MSGRAGHEIKGRSAEALGGEGAYTPYATGRRLRAPSFSAMERGTPIAGAMIGAPAHCRSPSECRRAATQ